MLGGTSGFFCGAPGIGIDHVGPAGTAAVHGTTVLGGTGCGGAIGAATSGAGITLGATPLLILAVSGTLTSTGSATIALTEGPPGAAFVIAVAGAPGFLSPGPPFLGEIVIDLASWFPAISGSLSASGDFSVTVPLAGIAPTALYVPVFLQGAAIDATGTLVLLSNGTVAIVRP